MKDFREQNFYELLDVKPHATPQEVENSYKRARKFLSPDSVATYALFQPEELTLIRKRIEEAFRVLSNAERRQRYDQEMVHLESGPPPEGGTEEARAEAAAPAAAPVPVPEEPAPAQSQPPPAVPSENKPVEEVVSPAAKDQEQSVTPAALPEVHTPAAAIPSGAAEPAAVPPGQSAAAPPAAEKPAVPSTPPPVQNPPMPAITEETEFSGELLKQIRQAKGLTIEKVAETTKINIFYLRAIEHESVRDLPADVYVRGYLRMLAKLLGLDARQLIDSYLEHLGRPSD